MTFLRFHKRLPKSSLLFTAALLLALSFLSSWFFQSKPSVAQQRTALEEYIQEQEKDADAVLTDTVLLRKLIDNSETEAEFQTIFKKRYGLFLFAETFSESHDLLFWNSQEILPLTPNFTPPDSTYFQHLLNGYYVIRKTRLVLPGLSGNMIAYVLIPVLNKYYLETENSQTQFAHDKNAVRRIDIADVWPTEFPVHSAMGKVLFYLKAASLAGPNYVDRVTLALRLLSLFLLLIYLHLVAEALRRRNPFLAVGFLALVLTVGRLVFYQYPEFFSLRQLSLFDPSIYASDFFNRSLGDLLISAFFMCWVVLFAWAALGPTRSLPPSLKGGGRIAAGLAAVFVLIFCTFQLANVVHDLVTASKISFDVTNFFSLSVYSVFGFLALALLTLTYYYFSRLLFRFVLLAFPTLLYVYLAVAVVGLGYLTLRTGNLVVLFHLPVLGWLVFYTLLLSREDLIINRIRMTVAGILFWIFIFSCSLALLIMQGNGEREWQDRKNIAEKLERLSDPAQGSMVRVTLASLNNDFLRKNFRRFFTEPENQRLRDSIMNSNSLGYAGSYSTEFYVFNNQNTPVNNQVNRSYEELNNILERQSKFTGSGDLYFYETTYDQFVYITKREVFADSSLIGTLFIVAAPRQFQNNDALYPNLFVRTNENNIENSPLYSFAVYKEKKLMAHSNKYPFPTTIASSQVPQTETAKVQNGDYDELWYKGSGPRVVVIAKKKDALIESITLFSYLFCAFLFMVGLLRIVQFAARMAAHWRPGEVFSKMSIRTQIHSTIIFISVLSFLIIGVATIQFFINRYKRNNVDRLSRISGGAATEMGKRFQEDSLLNSNALNFSDSLTPQAVRQVVREIADVHGVIVNLYDLSGTLQVTSDEGIYKKGILSTRMNPFAFFQLDNVKVVQYVQDEHAGQLDYLSIYMAMRNSRGDTYAYLNIPSFTTQIELNQEISNFLVTIINLNAFIFLVAGVLALFITNRITRSFSVIAEKMKAITLGRTNEEIVWEKQDEIGELVKQYNRMVHQLEQSAQALAKSEREGAWREMARQVAHEIKNPLTPMKLSIQYLQRAIQTNQPNVQQLTSNVANTLIEQIEHLSKIAADFSQFAAINQKRVEMIDLHSILGSLVSLYTANPKMSLQWNHFDQPLWMRADKTQMNRLFTNLLTNASDACSEERKCLITIDERTVGSDVIVSVSDNGEGIPADMRSKIFTPNFTTKTSGTGLGLAMCKSIVEQAGGAIWFDTKEGEGTTFYVRLPLESE